MNKEEKSKSVSKDVSLNISDKEIRGRGWYDILASDGVTTYWYKYNGGRWGGGNGDNKFRVPRKDEDAAPQTFDLTFNGNDHKTYKFVSYQNKNAPSDLSGDVKGDNLVTIADKCENEGDFYWGVTVAVKKEDGDTTPTVTFECDPMVRNIFS